jgi:hypothetical protein
MSVPTLVWIDSIQVGNSTAKALLRYLATHNFHKPGFFFKNSTYAKALEVSERSIQRSFDLLENKKFITVERRFDESGRQISNGIYFNIPDEFLNNYERTIESGGEGDKPIVTQGEGDSMSPLGVTQCQGGGRHNVTPYNNKRSNNKINNKKSFYENSKKHDFSESMDKMANEEKHIEEHRVFKSTPMPENLRKMYKSLGKTISCNKYMDSITTRREADGHGCLAETRGREAQGT